MKTEQKIANAIKWIDGLETTTEKQTTNKLGDTTQGFCCLGFGCHVLGIKYGTELGTSTDFANSVGLIDDLGSDGLEHTLTELNDHYKMTFKEIAQQIKEDDFDRFRDDVRQGLQNHYSKY